MEKFYSFHGVIKGVVRQYCYDVRPFNLTACFITKCDGNVMITCSKLRAMDNNVQ